MELLNKLSVCNAALHLWFLDITSLVRIYDSSLW